MSARLKKRRFRNKYPSRKQLGENKHVLIGLLLFGLIQVWGHFVLTNYWVGRITEYIMYIFTIFLFIGIIKLITIIKFTDGYWDQKNVKYFLIAQFELFLGLELYWTTEITSILILLFIFTILYFISVPKIVHSDKDLIGKLIDPKIGEEGAMGYNWDYQAILGRKALVDRSENCSICGNPELSDSFWTKQSYDKRYYDKVCGYQCFLVEERGSVLPYVAISFVFVSLIYSGVMIDDFILILFFLIEWLLIFRFLGNYYDSIYRRYRFYQRGANRFIETNIDDFISSFSELEKNDWLN